MNFSDLKECPFCGNDEFYVNFHMTGSSRYHKKFDGTDGAWNGEMYDMLGMVSGVRAYCNNCFTYVGNIETNRVSKKVEEALKGGNK